ncbi:flagellar assembly protein T N-terminal domain-containing protein [Rheinheimera sp. YQF-2]|uniref:Flagellar assembly protein T N-terminal domain-containing protein n=1 Tax=Rheinheimera lutimaris TaxID=2740584 RepID=A0A7Y5EII5_9GAMM|nr:flagellar assembly protein T N-terminal domain-containing protein [Rheinheimera lutimaris]NRQ42346.1 flagellar assembly protein T N-terminal domain-containing protein [Rheinheimera lutimaris]
MKNHVMFSVLAWTLFSTGLSADWYEATGQAIVEQGNTEAARQAAIDDAVKRAALFAGASLSSTQQMLNGVLQTEQLGVVSNGEIKQLQLLSESRSGNVISVSIRVDIEPQLSGCVGNTYRKPLLLGEVQLRARQDAIYGRLFELGIDATTQLERHLRDYSPTALVTRFSHSITPQQLVYPDTDRLFNDGHRYVLSAAINDLSLGQTTSRFWQQDQKERFFAIEITLYDLFEQSTVHQQEYRTSASWPYKSNNTPLSHSQAFWQMPYGQKIDQVLQAVAEDVQQQLQCEPLLSTVVQVKNNQITLALGEMHGLQQGDELQLFQLQRNPGSPQIKRLLQSPVKLQVTNLNDRNAQAVSTEQQLLQHIQPGDVVSVRKSSGY